MTRTTVQSNYTGLEFQISNKNWEKNIHRNKFNSTVFVIYLDKPRPKCGECNAERRYKPITLVQ